MTWRIICILLTLITLNSCDSYFFSKGEIIDSKTQFPVDSAKISIKGWDPIYTDSKGRFEISKPYFGTWTDFEILIEKDNYIPKYLNITKDGLGKDSVLIELRPTIDQFNSSFTSKSVKTFYLINLLGISLINFLTLIFIIRNKKIRSRIYWIIGILCVNLTFSYLYLDFSLLDYEILNFPIFLTHYKLYPFTIKIVIPIVTMIFWFMYLVIPKQILKN